ncbi:MAG TPA: hypothetical protein DEP66_02370, partial [Acidimicrobiaceae bacterium]|nr:hypothetical protein [Acidimicrobiaceae bacterium]
MPPAAAPAPPARRLPFWLFPTAAGAALGAVVAALSPLGWWLTAVGVVLGAAVWAHAHSRAERWLRRAAGFDAAVPSDAAADPRLHNLLESVCLTGGVEIAAAFVLERPQANLLVLGRQPHVGTLLVTR